jgi:NitT/TauT family transport system permease protein
VQITWFKTEGGWIKLISIGLPLLLWYVAALAPAKPIFPPPHIVLGYLIADIQTWAIWSHLLITLTRIVLGFALATAVAVPFGILSGFSKIAQKLFGSWVVIGLMTPSVVFIMLAYTSIGPKELAAVDAAALAVVRVPSISVFAALPIKEWHDSLKQMRCWRLSALQ